jgi:hypothetical protein
MPTGNVMRWAWRGEVCRAAVEGSNEIIGVRTVVT